MGASPLGSSFGTDLNLLVLFKPLLGYFGLLEHLDGLECHLLQLLGLVRVLLIAKLAGEERQKLLHLLNLRLLCDIGALFAHLVQLFQGVLDELGQFIAVVCVVLVLDDQGQFVHEPEHEEGAELSEERGDGCVDTTDG